MRTHTAAIEATARDRGARVHHAHLTALAETDVAAMDAAVAAAHACGSRDTWTQAQAAVRAFLAATRPDAPARLEQRPGRLMRDALDREGAPA